MRICVSIPDRYQKQFEKAKAKGMTASEIFQTGLRDVINNGKGAVVAIRRLKRARERFQNVQKLLQEATSIVEPPV
jgi:hypothetical protein